MYEDRLYYFKWHYIDQINGNGAKDFKTIDARFQRDGEEQLCTQSERELVD